jgi:uncharacterized phage protein gp47/JayE
MATTPVCTIDATGIHVPSFNDVLTYLQGQYRGIYGADVYLGNDSQDGQLLGIYALAISDSNAAVAAAYNAFSPATAQGAGLSSVVKINGIARNIASFSSVDLTIVGQAGTTISNGIAADANGNQWLLPASVTIPPAGTIIATATAASIGAQAAAPNTITNIATPTRGWQTVNNASSAAAGAPVESDPALRKRQTTSTALPSNTILEGIMGAIAEITGVTRYQPYENDTITTDSHGIPANALAIVVEGGDAQTIANTIAARKSIGGPTFGTTSETVTDVYGISRTINFFRPTAVTITVAIALKALTGYTTAVDTSIKQAVVDYINATGIGGQPSGTVEWDGAITAAKSVSGAATFRMSSLALSRTSGAGTPDVPLTFNEAATAALVNVTITVT